MNREIPLVADEWAKPELGSGCVKITPAHDANDYDVWQRHKEIGAINILNPDGTLNEHAGPYQGLKVLKARDRVVADLESPGLLEKTEDREIDLAHSDRSKTPIEPYLADQWFVRMGDLPPHVAASLRDANSESRRDSATCPGLAQTAMDAVTSGRVKIHPERYGKTYLDWLGEKRDWCIGRQLWWGHRVPIWYAPTASEADLKKAFAGRPDVAWYRDEEHERWLVCTEETDLPSDAVPGHNIEQDSDVLDTWFSSALWPHSTLGWPEKTPELAYYYPTSALLTSRGIITLWVARMVLAGLYNLGEVPFHDVYIHPTILDGYGETMSKSKGNGVDPLDVIGKFGTDALRFGVAHMATETQDVRLPVEFECPHCHKAVEQTQKNRVLPRVKCTHCGQEFSTQWAAAPADAALPRAAVTSERFELARNFCNKLWNAARFTLLNLEGYTPAAVDLASLATEDRWILSRLSTVTGQVSGRSSISSLPTRPACFTTSLGTSFAAFTSRWSRRGCKTRPRAGRSAGARVPARYDRAAVAPADPLHHRGNLAAVGGSGPRARTSSAGRRGGQRDDRPLADGRRRARRLRDRSPLRQISGRARRLARGAQPAEHRAEDADRVLDQDR